MIGQGRLSEKEVLAQSRAAFGQWESKWKDYASRNGIVYKRQQTSHRHLLHSGYGKVLIVCGMGASLEKHIATLKEYQNKSGVEISVCDKGYKILMENGIKPKYVVVADAVVDYEKWAEPFIEESKDVNLISCITANPKWAENWKGKVYFWVNKDNIQSELVFTKISGCNELIPASSNVGNSNLVFSTQILGYDEYYLVGYDFSWKPNENYYAFNDSDKRYWMKVGQSFGSDNSISYTSSNLLFSCRWLQDFINGPMKVHGYNIYNCSGQGILNMPAGDLVRKLKRFKQRYPDAETDKAHRMARGLVKRIATIQELIDLQKENEVYSIEAHYGQREYAAC